MFGLIKIPLLYKNDFIWVCILNKQITSYSSGKSLWLTVYSKYSKTLSSFACLVMCKLDLNQHSDSMLTTRRMLCYIKLNFACKLYAWSILKCALQNWQVHRNQHLCYFKLLEKMYTGTQQYLKKKKKNLKKVLNWCQSMCWTQNTLNNNTYDLHGDGEMDTDIPGLASFWFWKQHVFCPQAN